ncbi:MAG: flagellar M-ring protein FliF C-terminal domain-containing protein [Porcipelethomonas sp.]
MKEKFKGLGNKIKALWSGLAKTVRIIIVAGAAALIIGAVVLTIVLNSSGGSEYIVLFPGMSSEESTEVYLELQNMGVETKINSDGEIEVKRSEWDNLVYELADRGYPQTAPSYGTFFDNLSMTMTEFEKKQTLRFELQDRLQTTLKRIEGVKGAVVTINLPESDNYAWKEETETASASVTLTLYNSANFTSENVSAVKKLVAYSAQQMEPEDVIVIDSRTGNELLAVEDETNASGGGISTEEKLEYAEMIRNQYETAAKRILQNIYPEGVDAVAAVELDYDIVEQEVKRLLTDENGNGVLVNEEVEYKTNAGTVDDGGITGEESNSDIPNYQNDAEDDLNSDNTPYYHRESDWDTGYELTQTVKDRGGIKSASISVVVTTENAYLSRDQRNNVIELVRNATNIPVENISVYARETDEIPVGPTPDPNPRPITKNIIILIVLCGLVLLLIIFLIIFVMSRRMKKKLKKQKEESDSKISELQEVIEESNRKSLVEAAQEHTQKERATEMEVRQFAKENPEITAALIRSLLKERE